jgi:hypothetical protein
MAAEKIRYKRLPGRLQGIVHTASLWLGDDHLLAVSGWRLTEDYKRFYYRDIQAVVITRAPRLIVPLPWVVVVLGLAITALIANANAVEWLVEGCESLLMISGLYLLIVSLAFSCRCRIQTAVSCQELPSLCRLGAARRAVAIIERRIGEVQGALVENWMASLPSSFAPELVPPPTSQEAASPRPRAAAVELALYASLLVGGGWLFRWPMGTLWTITLALETLLGVGVLIDGRLHRRARSASVVAAMAMVLAGAVAYADNFVAAFRQAAANPGRINMTIMPKYLGHTPFLREIYAAGCLVLFAAGVFSVLLRPKE